MSAIPLVEATMAGLMERNARDFPDGTAFICGDVRYSWRECDAVSDAIAVRLLERGFARGSRVGVWSMNDIGEVMLIIAAMKIGAVPAVINYSHRGLELARVVDCAELEALMIGIEKRGSDYWRMGNQALAICPSLRALYGIREDFEAAERAFHEGKALRAPERERLEAAERLVDAHDTACIIFGSATAGNPRPVMLSLSNIVNDILQLDVRLGLTRDDAIFGDLPLFRFSGMVGLLLHAVVAAVPAAIHPMFAAERALQSIEKYHLSVLMAAPSMIDLLMMCRDLDECDLSSLRAAVILGPPVSPARTRGYIEGLGLDCVLSAYGQIECEPAASTVPVEDDVGTLCGASGKPLDHIGARAANPGSGEELPCGATGEAWARGLAGRVTASEGGRAA